MADAIVLRRHGPPKVLQLERVAVPPPGPGEVLLRQTAVAVNFHDIYVRSGLYRTLALPGVPGLEAAGVVMALGAGVTGIAPGDRVVYACPTYGAYASERVIEAVRLVRLPPHVNERLAASVFLRGLTAAILVRQVRPIREDDTVLVHAAAGGVGHLLVQWARHLGARVIGTAGTAEKAQIARASGCEEVILYRTEDFAERVLEITAGRGADAVFDGVGRDTFDGSLRALATRGHLVNYGQSSGPVPPFEIARLAPKSATISRPGYAHYVSTRAELEQVAGTLFDALATFLRAEPGRAFPLSQAAAAHAALEQAEAGPFILEP